MFEEITAKIAKFIAGQGTAVDASGKLPEVLTDIINLIPDVSGFFEKANIVGSTGQNTDKVMSQKAVTDALAELAPSYMVEVTYADLKAIRDDDGLIPGMFYRITDYETKIEGNASVVGINAVVANHPFDVIVLALTENTISEDAWATLHDGDTYFANNNLSAWRLKYSLDNNKSLFGWADETNGKGVIYCLTDEFNNCMPFDFKNIKNVTNLLLDQNQYVVSIDGADATLTIARNVFVSPRVDSGVYKIPKFTASVGNNPVYDIFVGSGCDVNFNGSYFQNVRFEAGASFDLKVSLIDCHFGQNTRFSSLYENFSAIYRNINVGSNSKVEISSEIIDSENIVIGSNTYVTIMHSGSSGNLQNYNIGSMIGNSSSSRNITLERGRNYMTFVGKNSSGETKTWCPADLVQ